MLNIQGQLFLPYENTNEERPPRRSYRQTNADIEPEHPHSHGWMRDMLQGPLHSLGISPLEKSIISNFEQEAKLHQLKTRGNKP